jgi:hypothetical protein
MIKFSFPTYHIKIAARFISTNGDTTTSDNNSSIPSNEFKYLGDFARENPKVNFKVVDKTDFISLNPIGDLSDYDYTEESLLKIGEDNYHEIDNLIKNLDPNYSFALIFLVRNSETREVATLDKHILVNNTTPVLPIFKRI